MDFTRTPILAVLCATCLSPAFAQRELSGSAETRIALDRLNVVGSVLMIAAHPDDENTALLAYLARGRKVRTGYLSLTRGEGGQNLIGAEQGDALGIIRTQELLAARRIDGAEQFFTRAIDFGFTKTPQEALEKWGHDKILSDVVWVIRRFRPDVIILRFSGTPRDGHGQHQASAILGREAFAAAADPKKFPEQLQWVEPWQTTRLMWNPGAFTKEQREEVEKMPNRITVDPGDYDPILGHSYAEIAGMSRSMHRSQGMGAAERKGSAKDYLITQSGPVAKQDIFDGIDISWKRISGGAPVGQAIGEAARAFNPEDPAKIVPLLLKAEKAMAGLHDPYVPRKEHELSDAIALCSGLWLDATADKFAVTPGGALKFEATALNRDHMAVQVKSVDIDGLSPSATKDKFGGVLPYNEPKAYAFTTKVPEHAALSQPYWLVEAKQGDTYTVPNQQDVGLPENPPLFQAHFHLTIESQDLEVVRPVQYRYIERAQGELTRPVIVEPPVALQWSESAILFPNESPKTIELQVQANVAKAIGEVQIQTPPGWRISSKSGDFDLISSGEQGEIAFQLTPPASSTQGPVSATAHIGNQTVATSMETINYPHIPPQVLFPPASAKLVRSDVRLLAKSIGYVMGAGDEVPQALRQLDAQVSLLSSEDLASGNLSRFDAIVTGVRAYNVRADLRANEGRLLEYVKNGGTLVVQYNVAEGGNPFGGDTNILANIGPYPITTGRERVTVEEAPVEFLHPESPLLHRPNEITENDFAGWIQERGLYFASQWDHHYLPLFETHDPMEKPLTGSTLYTPFGKGAYIFTAFSWFRELPAGVPGAFRIFANFLSAGKN
ncbi:MAG TPA: PIG-L family deacetylase [Bryobacteraceae bacterium]|nr:PIG-L family deacetylase [Bryobacteraceae bacterium]